MPGKNKQKEQNGIQMASVGIKIELKLKQKLK